MLHVSSTELVESQVTENLLHDFNEAYNAKQGKGWSPCSTPNQAPTLSAAG